MRRHLRHVAHLGRHAVLGALVLAALLVSPTRTAPRVAGAEETPPPPDGVPSAPRLVETHFWSVTLEREMPYTIYLPAGYDSSLQRYPVLYMLHGLGGDFREWVNIGMTDTATKLIASGSIPAMIIVMPEGGRGYWTDPAGSGPGYSTYVSNDLVGHIDDRYRTIAARRSRAIGGLSMGAHGALDIGLNNPGEFSVIGAHSLALRSTQDAMEFFGTAENWAAHDPRTICSRNGDTVRNYRIKLWLDIGSNDRWVEQNRSFHDELNAVGIAHTWTEWPGGHDWTYWSAHEADYLRFYGTSLRSLEGRSLS